MRSEARQIPCITNDGRGPSRFGIREIVLDGDAQWSLSEQQPALNFRLRSSAKPYQSDWHVAGDPTLLIILAGVIEIELRDGSTRSFSVGDMFIAEDYLEEDAEFDSNHTGHRARIVSEVELQALHLKLAKR